MISYPIALLADFYKLGHREQYPEGTQTVYTALTPRSNKFFEVADDVVVFGIQAFIKKYLIESFDETFFKRPKTEVMAEYSRIVQFGLGKDVVDTSHLEELHDLGYLPIRLRALPEGTLAPIRVPVLTIENTLPRFFWLTNFLETVMSTALWQPMTSATISHEYRKILDKYAYLTVGDNDHVDFAAHDFSMRGMSSVESGETSGSAHLLSFKGTDTIPAILHLEKYYNADIEKELVGASIPATEHSVMCSYGQTSELELFKHLITKVYPSGAFSVVSDTWDFWKVVEEYLPALKSDILNRDGKVVIRPDSGDPVSILCGSINYDIDDTDYAIRNFPNGLTEEQLHKFVIESARDYVHDEATTACDGRYCMGDDLYTAHIKVNDKIYSVEVEVEYNRHDKTYYYVEETIVNEDSFKEVEQSIHNKGLIEGLWDIFGGTVNDKGYKVLDTHIGAIYGDSITLERAEQICSRLEAKGFASSNVVLGIGAFSFQMNTRDTLGFATKATYAVVNGEERLLFKDPKTDDGTKKSQRGRIVVTSEAGKLQVKDGLYQAEYNQLLSQGLDSMRDVFVDGKLLVDVSLNEIRNTLLNK